MTVVSRSRSAAQAELFDLLNEVIHDDLKKLGVAPLAQDGAATPVTPHLANALLPKILEWAANEGRGAQ